MGMSTDCAVVPFKLFDRDWNNPQLNNIISQLNKTAEDLYVYGRKSKPVSHDGWDYHAHCATTYKDKNKNTIYCSELRCGDLTLFVVNEHEWSNGGGESYCAFGTSKEALEQLRKDWKLKKVKITENDTVQQTL